MRYLLLLLLFASLTGCSGGIEAAAESLNQNEHSYAIVNLGADNVYVGNHHITIPADIDAGLISDIDVIYMGALHDVLNRGFWNCETEFEMLLFIDIDDISEFIVLELLSSSNELLGHSISHSPVDNANTHECYEIEFIEIFNASTAQLNRPYF